MVLGIVLGAVIVLLAVWWGRRSLARLRAERQSVEGYGQAMHVLEDLARRGGGPSERPVAGPTARGGPLPGGATQAAPPIRAAFEPVERRPSLTVRGGRTPVPLPPERLERKEPPYLARARRERERSSPALPVEPGPGEEGAQETDRQARPGHAQPPGGQAQPPGAHAGLVATAGGERGEAAPEAAASSQARLARPPDIVIDDLRAEPAQGSDAEEAPELVPGGETTRAGGGARTGSSWRRVSRVGEWLGLTMGDEDDDMFDDDAAPPEERAEPEERVEPPEPARRSGAGEREASGVAEPAAGGQGSGSLQPAGRPRLTARARWSRAGAEREPLDDVVAVAASGAVASARRPELASAGAPVPGTREPDAPRPEVPAPGPPPAGVQPPEAGSRRRGPDDGAGDDTRLIGVVAPVVGPDAPAAGDGGDDPLYPQLIGPTSRGGRPRRGGPRTAKPAGGASAVSRRGRRRPAVGAAGGAQRQAPAGAAPGDAAPADEARRPAPAWIAATGTGVAVVVAAGVAVALLHGGSASTPRRSRTTSASASKTKGAPGRSRRAPRSTTTVPRALRPSSSNGAGASYSVKSPAISVVVSTSGPCWVEDSASPNGALLWEGMMGAGQVRTIDGTGSLWIRVGDASNVSLKLNGHTVGFPSPGSSPYNFTFSAGGSGSGSSGSGSGSSSPA